MNFDNNNFIVPDIVLFEVLNKSLDFLRIDYETYKSTPARSYLNQIFKSLNLGKYIMFDEAVSLISNNKESTPYVLKVSTAYDPQSSSRPQIHISMPSESNSGDGIGMDEGYREELVIGDDSYKSIYTRRFAATYQLVITTDNKNSVLCLYHIIRAILISSQTYLETIGMQNIKFGGSDLSLRPDIADRTFIRSLSVYVEYDTSVPEKFASAICRNIRVNSIIKTE